MNNDVIKAFIDTNPQHQCDGEQKVACHGLKAFSCIKQQINIC